MMEETKTLEIVEKILQNAQSEGRYKSTEVTKDIDVELDLGNLLAADPNPLDLKELRSNRDAYLLDCARDDVQLLVNDLWKLPVEIADNIHVVKLPAPKTIVPREKPLPAPKKPTKWEEYARVKGITKHKRKRMVWDEQEKDWKPRWGYNRANDNTKDWLIEVPSQADPNEDQFEKRLKAKKEKIAKNELQRLRNIARNMKGKVPGVGLTPVDKPDKNDLSKALSVARTSTASIGKFTDALPKEKPEKRGKKRKFESNYTSQATEKNRSLDILRRLQTNQPLLDADKSANRLVAAEQHRRADTKMSSNDSMSGGGGRRSKKVGGGGRKGSSLSSGGGKSSGGFGGGGSGKSTGGVGRKSGGKKHAGGGGIAGQLRGHKAGKRNKSGIAKRNKH